LLNSLINIESVENAVEVYNRYSVSDLNCNNTDMLYDMIICAPELASNAKENEQKILSFYNKAWEDAIPYLPRLIDIMSYIYDYNESICYQIALINFINSDRFRRVADCDIPDVLEEDTNYILDICLYNDSFYELDKAVFNILREKRLSFTVTEDSTAYSSVVKNDEIIYSLPERGKEYMVVVEDCQNTLLPMFGIEEMFLYDSYVLYSPGV